MTTLWNDLKILLVALTFAAVALVLIMAVA